MRDTYPCTECGSIDTKKENGVWFCMSRSCGYATKREFICVTVGEQRAIDRAEGRL